MEKGRFAAIQSSLFVEGMHIKSGLYYKLRDEYILLCKNVVLSNELIRKITQFSSENRSIYVDRDDYEQVYIDSLTYLEEQGSAPPANSDGVFYTKEAIQETIKSEKAYNSVTSDTEAILHALASTGTVSLEDSDKVFSAIEDQLLGVNESTLLQCINTIREGDHYLYTHCVDVAILNGLIGRWLKLSTEEIQALIRTGYFHDLGKLRIAPEILNKPAALTATEFEIVKKHAPETYDILYKSGERDKRILAGARSHHERNNGTGYPDGLGQDDIHLFAKITAISDVYSAMVSRRVYKPQNSPFVILEAFAMDRFSDLDYSLVTTFLAHMPQEFVGKSVILSNGETARVMYVPRNNLSHPIVMTHTGVVETDQTLSCVSMSNPLSLFIDQPFLDAQKDTFPFQ